VSVLVPVLVLVPMLVLVLVSAWTLISISGADRDWLPNPCHRQALLFRHGV